MDEPDTLLVPNFTGTILQCDTTHHVQLYSTVRACNLSTLDAQNDQPEVNLHEAFLLVRLVWLHVTPWGISGFTGGTRAVSAAWTHSILARVSSIWPNCSTIHPSHICSHTHLPCYSPPSIIAMLYLDSASSCN